MQITEEQRRRSEANRLVALEKRKRIAEAAAAASTSYATTAFAAPGTPTFPTYDTAAASAEWRLPKCPRIAPPAPQHLSAPLPPRPSPPQPPPTPPQPPVGFKVVLEVCSPDEFLVAVEPLEGKAYPGEVNCLGAVQDSLSAASVRLVLA
jgi:hypothetical protein